MVVCAPRPVDQLLLPWRALGCSTASPVQPPPPPSLLPTVGYQYGHHQSTTVNPWPQFPYSPPGGASGIASGGMKRTMSDSDSDDVFDDVSSKGTPTQSNESCQMVNRKKRRGIIEKRRRDRINTSLTELRRLVPTAFEKQGSAKLEKAEILQMTVDHLKMLHAKGFDAFSFDPHKFAIDYHSIGFRECAAEVARYMVSVEGMDVQDPLRLRLMSHLQCYSAQRELAAKQASNWNSTASPWTTGTAGSGLPPSSSVATATHPSGQFHQPSASASTNQLQHMVPTEHLPCSGTDHLRLSDGGPASPHHMRLQAPPPPPPASQAMGVAGGVSSSGVGPGGMMHHHQHHHPALGQMHQYPVSLNVSTHHHHHGFASAMSPPSGYSPTSTTNSSQAGGHSVKPYRPWGAELAY